MGTGNQVLVPVLGTGPRHQHRYQVQALGTGCWHWHWAAASGHRYQQYWYQALGTSSCTGHWHWYRVLALGTGTGTRHWHQAPSVGSSTRCWHQHWAPAPTPAPGPAPAQPRALGIGTGTKGAASFSPRYRGGEKQPQTLALGARGAPNSTGHWYWAGGCPKWYGAWAPACTSTGIWQRARDPSTRGSAPTPAPNGGAPSSTGHRSPASPSPPPLPAGRALRPSTSASRPLRAASCWFWGCGGAGDAAFSPKKGFCLVSLCSAACRPGLLPAHTEPLPSRSPSGPGRPWQGLHARKEIAAQMQDE
ncbi:TBC1 domain family member 10B-like [Anas acuta]|uniref:TBC1 domain family member 10B-like n=1 Tax=Anas acuta TaxID=28680 RepID=UPI0035C8A0B3